MSELILNQLKDINKGKDINNSIDLSSLTKSLAVVYEHDILKLKHNEDYILINQELISYNNGRFDHIKIQIISTGEYLDYYFDLTNCKQEELPTVNSKKEINILIPLIILIIFLVMLSLVF